MEVKDILKYIQESLSWKTFWNKLVSVLLTSYQNYEKFDVHIFPEL